MAKEFKKTLGCVYLDRCLDTARLRQDPGNKDLANQHYELCTAGGQEKCLTHREFSNDR